MTEKIMYGIVDNFVNKMKETKGDAYTVGYLQVMIEDLLKQVTNDDQTKMLERMVEWKG